MIAATHYKGFDQFPTVTYHTGAEALLKALKDSASTMHFMPAHEAQRDFPQTMEALSAYNAVILSDIGANTLLLHPDTWIHSKTTPNRLRLLRDYVRDGGGLLMFGGYYSFQGINGGARYHKTPVEEVLPVDCLPVDDRVEVPEGFPPSRQAPDHPILQGLGRRLAGAARLQRGHAQGRAEWSARRVWPSDGLPAAAGRPAHYGKGRTLAWTSDVGPHWLPHSFVAWPGYARLWRAGPAVGHAQRLTVVSRSSGVTSVCPTG